MAECARLLSAQRVCRACPGEPLRFGLRPDFARIFGRRAVRVDDQRVEPLVHDDATRLRPAALVGRPGIETRSVGDSARERDEFVAPHTLQTDLRAVDRLGRGERGDGETHARRFFDRRERKIGDLRAQPVALVVVDGAQADEIGSRLSRPAILAKSFRSRPNFASAPLRRIGRSMSRDTAGDPKDLRRSLIASASMSQSRSMTWAHCRARAARRSRSSRRPAPGTARNRATADRWRGCGCRRGHSRDREAANCGPNRSTTP